MEGQAQPSATQTTTTGSLQLRGEHTDQRRVRWAQNTVDNENCGRKSSKICCIYHKPKEFDESSSSSSESDSEDDKGKAKEQPKQEAKAKESHDCTCEKNAYEKK